jgi:hypothetical protein
MYGPLEIHFAEDYVQSFLIQRRPGAREGAKKQQRAIIDAAVGGFSA